MCYVCTQLKFVMKQKHFLSSFKALKRSFRCGQGSICQNKAHSKSKSTFYFPSIFWKCNANWQFNIINQIKKERQYLMEFKKKFLYSLHILIFMGSLKPWKGHSDVVKVLFVKTKPSQNQKAPFHCASIFWKCNGKLTTQHY